MTEKDLYADAKKCGCMACAIGVKHVAPSDPSAKEIERLSAENERLEDLIAQDLARIAELTSITDVQREDLSEMTDDRNQWVAHWNAAKSAYSTAVTERDQLEKQNAELLSINEQIHAMNRKLVARAVDAETEVKRAHKVNAGMSQELRRMRLSLGIVTETDYDQDGDPVVNRFVYTRGPNLGERE